MTRYKKNSSGKYIIKGKTYDTLFGSRASVYHGNAYKTIGELVKPDIMMNKNGRIVSVRKHNTAKREKRLVRAGYLTKKGHFGFIKNGKMGKSGKSRKHRRGGSGGSSTILSPSPYPGSGNNLDSDSLLGMNGRDFSNDNSPQAAALSGGGKRRRRRTSRRG